MLHHGAAASHRARCITSPTMPARISSFDRVEFLKAPDEIIERHNRTEHVLQERHRAILVEKESHLL